MIEAGRPFTLFTLLRISEALGVLPEQVLAGLFHQSGTRTQKTGKS